MKKVDTRCQCLNGGPSVQSCISINPFHDWKEQWYESTANKISTTIQGIEAHQHSNWRTNSTSPAEYRWTDTVPPIRAGHVIEGHLRYNNRGTPSGSAPGTGYHHHAGGIDAEWHRTTIASTVDTYGLYQGTVELWDPLTRSWLPKSKKSTFFPDSFSEAQVHQAIQEAYIEAGSQGASNNPFVGTTQTRFDIVFHVIEIPDFSGNLVPAITSAYPDYTPPPGILENIKPQAIESAS